MAQSLFKPLFLIWLSCLTILFLSLNDYASGTSSSGLVVGRSQIVIFTGMFPPAQGSAEHGITTLTVYINKVKRDFIVTDIDSVNFNATTLQILNEISPRKLVFIGKKDILADLTKPQVEGKFLRLKGNLYVSDGAFLVMSKEEVEKQQH